MNVADMRPPSGVVASAEIERLTGSYPGDTAPSTSVTPHSNAGPAIPAAASHLGSAPDDLTQCSIAQDRTGGIDSETLRMQSLHEQ